MDFRSRQYILAPALEYEELNEPSVPASSSGLQLAPEPLNHAFLHRQPFLNICVTGTLTHFTTAVFIWHRC